MAAIASGRRHRLAGGVANPNWRLGPVALLLALAGLLAYGNTVSAPFIFDDIPALARDPATAPGAGQTPADWRGSGAAGRPVVEWSLALNRAISGDAVWSYHAFNLLVHLAAGLALFGVVRRTLRDADAVAFAVALLWVVHPLQTESVTCIIQRTESLAGLFYLMIFLGFTRVAAGEWTWGWVIVFAAGLFGAATKELVATAPMLLFLYDRTFVAGTFRAAWRERGRWHVALAATVWIVVGTSIAHSDVRGGTVGFGHGVAWWEYALTQCRAAIMYFKLALWPHPLVLDYGTDVVRDVAAVWPQTLLLAALGVATAWALWRRPKLGFLGAWCGAILAPSSSIVPLVTQTMAEHRMYLPLAAIVVGAMLGLRAIAGRWFAPLVAMTAMALLATTVARNRDYRSVESIWQDNLAKRPGNVRAHFTLAQRADERGDSADAIAHGEAAVRLLPADHAAHFNLAVSYAKAQRLADAEREYREAARLRPDGVDAHVNLGAVLVRLGRVDDAIAEYEAVARLRRGSAEDQFNLAEVYLAAGRTTDAIARYESAARLKPDAAETHYRLGNAWLRLRRAEDAARCYREAIRLDPQRFEAHVNLGGCLLVLGRPAEAIPVYEAALRLRPGDPVATANLARARAAAR